jgi:hypothetical protein
VWHAVCCTLEDGSDTHDCCSDENSLLSAKGISEDEGCDSAYKASNIVDGLPWKGLKSALRPMDSLVLYLQVSYRDCRLHIHVVTNAESIQEIISDDNAAKYTLIVTKLNPLRQQIDGISSIQYTVPESYQSHTRQ